MGSERFEKVGAVGRDEIAKLYGCDVLGIWQGGHFLATSVSAASIAARYDMEHPDMQNLMDSLRVNGWLQPGEVWYFDDTQTAHIVFGNRRTIATDYLNQQLLEADEDPITCRYKVVIKKSLTPAVVAEALARYADENNQRKGNDWMTVADSAAHQLRMGVDPGLVLARWPMIDSEKMLEELTADSGVRAACPELQQALATGQIPVRRAIRIARLPLAEQSAALSGSARRATKKPAAAVSMVKIGRLREALATDKRLEGISAADLLSSLLGPADNDAARAIREVLDQREKPGPKTKNAN